LVLILDQLESFLRAFGERDSGRLVDVLTTLLRQGPAAGLAIAFSTDRTGFPPRIAAAVEHRLVLRQADRDDVTAFGPAPRAVAPRPSPVRGLPATVVTSAADLPAVLAAASYPFVLAVDDAELITDPGLEDSLEEFARTCRDAACALLVAACTEDLLRSRFRGWLPQARRSRSGLLLNPTSN